LITCGDGEARIIYQGELRPGKFPRAPIPFAAFPTGRQGLAGDVLLCQSGRSAGCRRLYKAGLGITFRPNSSKRKAGAVNASSVSFFPAAEFRTEAELTDLGKWETVLHAENSYYGSSLLEPVFDVHYNAREAGGPHHPERPPFAMP
jgi:hypothetical protein